MFISKKIESLRLDFYFVENESLRLEIYVAHLCNSASAKQVESESLKLKFYIDLEFLKLEMLFSLIFPNVD